MIVCANTLRPGSLVVFTEEIYGLVISIEDDGGNDRPITITWLNVFNHKSSIACYTYHTDFAFWCAKHVECHP